MPLIKSFSLVFELAIGQQVLAFVLSSCNTLCFQGIKGALSQSNLVLNMFLENNNGTINQFHFSVILLYAIDG